MKKRKPGRPKLPRKYKRFVVVTFRALDNENGLFRRAAAKRGEKLSAWIRAELFAAATFQENLDAH